MISPARTAWRFRSSGIDNKKTGVRKFDAKFLEFCPRAANADGNSTLFLYNRQNLCGFGDVGNPRQCAPTLS